MSGIWKRRHGQTFRHRQPKGSATVKAEPTSTAPDLDSTLSRGLPVGLAPTTSPHRISHGERLEGPIKGGDVTRVGQAGSPGSDGASPYLCRRLPRHPVNLAYKLAPLLEPFRSRYNNRILRRFVFNLCTHREERRILGKHRSLARTEHWLEAYPRVEIRSARW